MSNEAIEKPTKRRIFKRISNLKCVYCGRNFTSLRCNSLYCGGTCANYACRDRKKGIEPNSRLEQIKPLAVTKKALGGKKTYKEQIKEITVQINETSSDFLNRYPKRKKFYNKTEYEKQYNISHQKILDLWKVMAAIKKANRKPRIKKPVI